MPYSGPLLKLKYLIGYSMLGDTLTFLRLGRLSMSQGQGEKVAASCKPLSTRVLSYPPHTPCPRLSSSLKPGFFLSPLDIFPFCSLPLPTSEQISDNRLKTSTRRLLRNRTCCRKVWEFGQCPHYKVQIPEDPTLLHFSPLALLLLLSLMFKSLN